MDYELEPVSSNVESCPAGGGETVCGLGSRLSIDSHQCASPFDLLRTSAPSAPGRGLQNSPHHWLECNSWVTSVFGVLLDVPPSLESHGQTVDFLRQRSDHASVCICLALFFRRLTNACESESTLKKKLHQCQCSLRASAFIYFTLKTNGR